MLTQDDKTEQFKQGLTNLGLSTFANAIENIGPDVTI